MCSILRIVLTLIAVHWLFSKPPPRYDRYDSHDQRWEPDEDSDDEGNDPSDPGNRYHGDRRDRCTCRDHRAGRHEHVD